MTCRLPRCLAVASLTLLLAACSSARDPSTSAGNLDTGPTTYDAGGVVSCARGTPDFKKACGYRVLRQADGRAEIWISNSIDGKPFYRVSCFAKGEFTTRDTAKIRVAKEAGTWVLGVGAEEHYRIPDTLITGA